MLQRAVRERGRKEGNGKWEVQCTVRMGSAVYGKIEKMRKKKFKKMEDDGKKKLHPAR